MSSVIVGGRADVLPMQTIRYRVSNGTLQRIVNGVPQQLAPGVTSATFAYGRSSSGNINRVDVTLNSVITSVTPGDAAKNRSLMTTVNLRNVY